MKPKNTIETVLATIIEKERLIEETARAAEAVKRKHATNAQAELDRLRDQSAAAESVRARLADAIQRRDELLSRIRVAEVQRDQQEAHKADLDRVITAQFGFSTEHGKNPSSGLFQQLLENFPQAKVSPLVLERLYPWIEARRVELENAEAELVELSKLK